MLVFKNSDSFLFGEDLVVGEVCSQLLTLEISKASLTRLAHSLNVQTLASVFTIFKSNQTSVSP